MSIKKDQILELFNSNPEKEFSVVELIEIFKVRTKPRKKIIPLLQSLTNTGYLYRMGRDRYVSSQSILAKEAKKIKISEPKNRNNLINKKKKTRPVHSREKGETVVGSFIKNVEGFGFVSSLDSDADVYIDRQEVMWNGIMHGDVIKISRYYEASRKRYYGKFIEFISRRDNTAIGKVIEHNGKFAVELRKTLEIVILQHGRLNGARKDDWVEVEIKKWPKGRILAYGEISKIVDTDSYVVLKEFKIRETFPVQVIEESKKIKEPPQEMSKYALPVYVDEKGTKRNNISSIPTVTIDGETARDFDDAVSYLTKGEEHLLYISIADVSHYVVPNSEIDKEALKRTTSVYFPDRAIPMLPETLSNDICSLKPDRYRYCMTVEILFNKYGHVKTSKIYPSVIRSHARLTYEQAQKIIQPEFSSPTTKDINIQDIDSEIKKMLKDMHLLFLLLRKDSHKRGTLFLDIPEAEIILDEKGDIKDIRKRMSFDAHSLIEEFMISANVQTAKKMKSYGKGVFRIHEKPSLEKLQAYSDVAVVYKSVFNPTWDKAGQISSYLKSIEENPARALLNKMLLRSLKKAKYSNLKDIGHFALALIDYTHFTSPIRRYPDLVVHRLLKGASYYDDNALKHISELCSLGETSAMEAERNIIRIKQARYMENKIGKEFLAEITGINDYGMFLQLKDVFIEGYLPFSKFSFDHFVFDPLKMSVSGKETKLKYKLGDEINVKVANVDIFEGKIEFLA